MHHCLISKAEEKSLTRGTDCAVAVRGNRNTKVSTSENLAFDEVRNTSGDAVHFSGTKQFWARYTDPSRCRSRPFFDPSYLAEVGSKTQSRTIIASALVNGGDGASYPERDLHKNCDVLQLLVQCCARRGNSSRTDSLPSRRDLVQMRNWSFLCTCILINKFASTPASVDLPPSPGSLG